ncbi:hypothetical protein [Alkalihalobacterium bogoriense]|uniref:hypothetical protein n=1 Tax=Alkalihalobacterium bogoriense TaxID=246272 RepID=UPI00047DDF5D|nr:hypothetical protein [Alkalihalobacterium bogoriense]
MKPFESLNHFVNHYKKKVTIPKTIEISINGKTHSFTRDSIHNKQDIGFNQWDKYIFKEGYSDNLDLLLKVNFYRYFDEKALFEAFFEFNHRNIKWISPIYFYDQFVYSKDFDSVRYSESLENWTGLKWIDTTRFESASLDNLRLDSFEELKKDLFYDSIHSERDPYEEEVYRLKWDINDKGDSPYFKKIEGTPNSWDNEDD